MKRPRGGKKGTTEAEAMGFKWPVFSTCANTFWRLHSKDGCKWFVMCSVKILNGRATIFMGAEEEGAQLVCGRTYQDLRNKGFFKHRYRCFTTQGAADPKLGTNCPIGHVYSDQFMNHLETFRRSGHWEIGDFILSAVKRLVGVREEEIDSIERCYPDETLLRPFFVRDTAVRRIQKQFRQAIMNPAYEICRTRLRREASELLTLK